MFAVSSQTVRNWLPRTDGDTSERMDSSDYSDSDDESRVSGEIDAVVTDANTVIESDNSFSGNAATVAEIVCDASVVVNKTTDPMTMTITYNGTNCGGIRKRTGVA